MSAIRAIGKEVPIPITLLTTALVGMLFALGARPAEAATFTVTNTNDSGVGSLRQARGSERVSGESSRCTVLAPRSILLRLLVTSITSVTFGASHSSGAPTCCERSSINLSRLW